MKKIQRTLNALGLGLTLLAAPLATQAADIIIGQVAPFSGTLAPTGKGVNLGIQAYFGRVNATGGVRGNRLKLVTRDDGYKVDETLAKTAELIDKEQPVALVGLVGTGNVAAVLKKGLLEKAGIPLVGVRSGAGILRTPVPSHIFHTRASYAAEVDTIVRQMQSMGLKRVAVFHQDDPFGEDGLAAAKKALAASGMDLVVVGTYPKGTTEVAEAVKAIHATDPNGIIMVSNTAASAAFVKGMREAGSFAMMIAVSVTAGPQVAEKIGNTVAHGLGIVQVVPKPESQAIPIARDLAEDLKRIGAKEGPDHTILEGYLMAKVLVEGIRRAGEPTRPRILAALNELGTYDAGGVTIRYSPDNHDGADYTDISILNRAGNLLR
ncbi:ABC transporter substrate-binding protein [Denitromonas iodatirespirans]|uniref:ABC transporter substrate-binding protein n=1 Tax=Denitromonas iodatirespirans TaxID=2795389 RepID=A0A944DE89_DENI1|nr:ABC transporter substrate-binding protein [Denitromonas iodatirespirans]MBT0963406.1 ABC transporter substrate-binding protein [Denitromonas iodatirespirans]